MNKENNRSSMVLDPQYRKAMDAIKTKEGIALSRQIHQGLTEFFKKHKTVLQEAKVTIKGVTE